MYSYLASAMDGTTVLIIGAICTFLLTAGMLKIRFGFLPHDQGRAYAVNGELSKGKIRGVGLIFIMTFVISCALFLPYPSGDAKGSIELVGYGVLLLLAMLSGYLDDASNKPWSEYKKGLIDLFLSVCTSVLFVYVNGSSVQFFAVTLNMPAWLYVILGTILIWASINVTNCTDGVDGLLGSVSCVTIASMAVLFSENLGLYANAALLMIAVLTAYLFFNTSPSSMLMGDAGSRAIGYFIALLAMKSGHPFAWLLLAIVMILDGGLGLIKISLKRFLKIWILKNTRTPLHDHCRKNLGWSDTQVVVRFSLLQLLACALAALILSI